jgi:hypothetical protein
MPLPAPVIQAIFPASLGICLPSDCVRSFNVFA